MPDYEGLLAIIGASDSPFKLVRTATTSDGERFVHFGWKTNPYKRPVALNSDGMPNEYVVVIDEPNGPVCGFSNSYGGDVMLNTLTQWLARHGLSLDDLLGH